MAILKPDQLDAVDKFLEFISHPTEKELVLEGYPGCGKSFVTKYMLEALENFDKIAVMIGGEGKHVNVELTATTNKAANVLGTFINTDKAKTIHSLLGLKVQNDFKTGTTRLVPNKRTGIESLNSTLIIIDEASYIDDYLLQIIRNNTYDCKILYIGDRYQLANVGTSQPPVFYDISNKAVLSESKRFSENSAIALAGQQLRDTIDTSIWKPIPVNGTDIVQVDSAEFQRLLDAEFTSISHKSEDARILAWTNKRVAQYNSYIRNKFTSNIQLQPSEEIIVAKTLHLAEGNMIKMLPVESELVINSIHDELPIEHRNHLNHRNGDSTNSRIFGLEADWEISGYWANFFKDGTYTFVPEEYNHYDKLLKLLAKQAKANKDWREFFYAKDYIADIRSAFATTVYKAQGSTYKKVFIDLEDIGKCHQWEQVARMLHVAITRASDQVILRGKLPEKYGG